MKSNTYPILSVLACALAFLSPLGIGTADGATLEVSLDGTKAYSKIQAAIDQSSSGDTVMVYPSTYVENIDFKGKNILVTSIYATTNSREDIAKTVIDGGKRGDAVSFTHSETRKAVLSGFTVKNGWIGIICDGSSPTLQNLIVRENLSVYPRGSGLRTNSGRVLVENCIFENNAINTCTVSMDGSLGFEVRNSIFRNNSVTDSAFECDSSVGVLSGLLIYGNSGAGIGIINADKGITILNSTIVKNSGGAIRVLYNNVTKSVINITNSILWNIVGKEVTINNPAPATFINISHTIIRGGTNSVIPLITTVLNLDAESIGRDDPMFVDSGSNDYSLSDVSKAIGSGISSGTPGYDLMGVVRPTPPGSNPDLGAIESILSFPVARLSNLSSVSGKVGALLVLALGANNNPLHYSAAGLPSGLTLDETSGLVNGTPLGGGVFKTVIAITNRGGTTTNLLTFEISKALPTISWNVPTSITWGQPLDASTYLATSETAGSFSFDPPIGSVLDVGRFTLKATFTPADSSSYEIATATRPLIVGKAQQFLDFTLPVNSVFGDPPVFATATASSGLPIRFEVVSGPARLTGSTIEILGGGTIGMRALQDGDSRYNAAAPVNRSIEVKLRPQIGKSGNGTVIKEPSSETLSYGTVLSLAAVPDSGLLFDGWRGDVVSKANPLLVIVTNNVHIDAVFVPQWTLTLSNTVGGLVISEPLPNEVKNGGNIAVTALPANGYGFRGWLGTFSTNLNPFEFVLNTNVTLTADFRRFFSVSMGVTVGGTVTVTPQSVRYLDGDPLTITATASEGYRFDGWDGNLNGLSATSTVTLTNDLTIQPRFKKLLQLITSQTGQGQVTVLGGAYHDQGESVTLQAQSAKGWIFSGWQGSVSGSENPVKLVMSTNTVIKAVFKQLFTLTVSASKGGVVEVNSVQTEYADGTSVTLGARPDQHNRFDHWEGSIKGTNSPVTITLTNNTLVIAVFVPAYRLLALIPQNLTLGFKLRAEGEVGGKYLIESSVGLVSWSPLATITNQTGSVEYLDTQASFLSRRFYRMRPENP